MLISQEEWADRVQNAAMAGDSHALTALYNEARTLFGDDASRHWAQALSAFDSSAITG